MISNAKIILKALRLFVNWPESLVDNLANQSEIIQIREGQNLSDFIEDLNDIFIIESGCIELNQQDTHQHRTVIFKSFDIICYRSLFEKYGKNIEINAFKNTIIIKLRYRDALKILSNHPQLVFDLAWYFSNLHPSTKKHNHKNCLTISLIPAGGTPDISSFAEALEQSLSFTGKTIYLNNKLIKKNHSSNGDIIDYIYKIQTEYKYVIFSLDNTIDKTQETLIKHSDKLCLVADNSCDTKLNLVEKSIVKNRDSENHECYLIVIKDQNSSQNKSSSWINIRSVKDSFVVRNKCNQDIGRLSRILTENGLGIVLSGGGARGFAHIGLFKALSELKINIDYIGGSSVGAGLGALYACGKDHKQIFDEFYNGFINFNSLGHYTFPLVSLYSGEKFKQVLLNSYGEVDIEDLLINFFCVASNLKTNNIEVYDRGKLWEKIRCSASIPGLLPPIITEKQDIIVDGGIINNLPVDVMRKKIGNSKILAVRLTAGFNTIHDHLKKSSAAQQSLLLKIFKSKRNKNGLNLGNVILSSMLVSSSHHDEIMMRNSDYLININTKNFGLLQLKEANKLVDYSYELCIKYLSESLHK